MYDNKSMYMITSKFDNKSSWYIRCCHNTKTLYFNYYSLLTCHASDSTNGSSKLAINNFNHVTVFIMHMLFWNHHYVFIVNTRETYEVLHIIKANCQRRVVAIVFLCCCLVQVEL